MTPSQYRELERQSEVIEHDKFIKLWNEFREQNPNTVGTFQEQFVAFEWLFKALISEKEKHINKCIL
jgi:hypothetical protein